MKAIGITISYPHRGRGRFHVSLHTAKVKPRFFNFGYGWHLRLPFLDVESTPRFKKAGQK